MREDITEIFGKDYKWFVRLPITDRIKILWFIANIFLICGIGNCSEPVSIAIVTISTVISAMSLASIDGKGLEDE